MGLDKEAADIWKFGRPRPDLTVQETVAAPEPPVEMHAERQELLRQNNKTRINAMSIGIQIGLLAAKHRRWRLSLPRLRRRKATT